MLSPYPGVKNVEVPRAGSHGKTKLTQNVLVRFFPTSFRSPEKDMMLSQNIHRTYEVRQYLS